MTVIVALIVGFLTGRMLWLAMRKSWHRQPLLRTNYQGVTLPTAAGVVLSLSLFVVEAGRQLLGALGAGDQPGLSGPRAGVLIAVGAFTILGLIDDLVGTSGSRGFKGHFQALTRGELTSGMVKFIGGATASLVAAGLVLAGATDHGFVALVLDAAIIALAANFFNLLDLRPGRSGKTAVAAFVVIAVLAKFDIALVPAAIVVGAAAALVLDDLREKLMLGDTGANALGATVGFALVTQVAGTGRWIAAAALLVLNLLSEVVSYTKIIDNFGPLRALDQMGRKRPGSASGQSGKARNSEGPTVDVRDERPAPAPARDDFRPPFDPSEFPGQSSSAGSSYSQRGQGNVGSAPETDLLSEAEEMDLRESLFGDRQGPNSEFSGHTVDDSMERGTGHRSDRI